MWNEIAHVYLGLMFALTWWLVYRLDLRIKKLERLEGTKHPQRYKAGATCPNCLRGELEPEEHEDVLACRSCNSFYAPYPH